MKNLTLPLIISMAFIFGCSQNYMTISPAKDNNPSVMYGKTPQRTFFYDTPLSDSLRPLWSAETNGSFSHSSVVVYDRYVFVSDLSGRVFCFNLENGKKVGQLKTKNGAVFSTPYVDIHQLIYVTALMDDNRSTLVYYNINDNDYIKEIKLKGRVETEMLVTDNNLILCTETGIIYCFNKKGDQQWEVRTGDYIHSSPVIDSSRFYFGTDNGDIVAMNIANGDSVYRKRVGGCFQGGGAISGNNLYIGNDNGSLYCIDYRSGNVNWSYKTESRIVMTPAYDNENVYAGNLAGDFFALNKNTGKVVWNKKLGSLFDTAPLVASNYLLIPDLFKKIYITDKKTGDIKKSMDYDDRVKLTPVIVNKKIVIIGYDYGILEAYEIL